MSRHLAEEIAQAMNKSDPATWDHFIEKKLPKIFGNHQGWG
jgi:hypothetical protein